MSLLYKESERVKFLKTESGSRTSRDGSAEHLVTCCPSRALHFPAPQSGGSHHFYETPAPGDPASSSGFHGCPHIRNIHTYNYKAKANLLKRKQGTAEVSQWIKV